jgi:hypothetical protein
MILQGMGLCPLSMRMGVGIAIGDILGAGVEAEDVVSVAVEGEDLTDLMLIPSKMAVIIMKDLHKAAVVIIMKLLHKAAMVIIMKHLHMAAVLFPHYFLFCIS